ncbi:MAG: hypothetical protein ACR2G7_03590 [Acidimicrobiales bacterium]
MIDDLVDVVVGPFGSPWPSERQAQAPWACTGCARRQGFRRRGFQPKPRQITTACGTVAFSSQQLEYLGCGRRFAPAAELLGLRPHQRRTEALSELAASLAVEVAYAKASRLLGELAGVGVSARTIRRNVIGLVTRSRGAKRVSVEARLLGATVGEGWDVMGELLASVRPGLVIVDGEEELSGPAAELFADRPLQRCLWHLARGTYRSARYSDKASHELSKVRFSLVA